MYENVWEQREKKKTLHALLPTLFKKQEKVLLHIILVFLKAVEN